MRTIAVVNQKGGCGKTTVSINLASVLAQLGRRTLLIDMDPQSHCAVGLAVPEEQIEQSIYEVLIEAGNGEATKLTDILWQISDRLELAPASIDLAAFEQQTCGISDRQVLLNKALDVARDSYDFAIIDCPPAVCLLTYNALRAASDVIVPVETGYFALHGLSKQLETISMLCQDTGQQVNVMVLASMYDVRTKMAREVLAELRSHFGKEMLKTVVNFNTRIKEAASLGQPINEYDPASKGHRDFRDLAEEVIGMKSDRQYPGHVKSLAYELAAISATADELLGASAPAVKPSCCPPPDTDTKLSRYYGVSQVDGAVMFVTLYPRAENVMVAGDFNGWQPEKTPMQKVADTGAWEAAVKLKPGTYRYRFVVDGKWQQDPYNELTEPNFLGDLNSILEVK